MPYPDLVSIGLSKRTKTLLNIYRDVNESWDVFFQRLIEEAVKADHLEDLLIRGELIPNPGTNQKPNNQTDDAPSNKNEEVKHDA
jgi:hypothetical protein